MTAPSKKPEARRPGKPVGPVEVSLRRRKFGRIWDQTLTVLKWIILPVVFLAGAAGVMLAGFYISLGPPWLKLAGFALLMASFATLVVGLWVAFDRPKQWGRRR